MKVNFFYATTSFSFLSIEIGAGPYLYRTMTLIMVINGEQPCIYEYFDDEILVNVQQQKNYLLATVK